MPFTREQILDVKTIIKETIAELINDDHFISVVVEKVQAKLDIDSIERKTSNLEDKINELQKENTSLKEIVYSLEQNNKQNNIRIFGLPLTDTNVENDVLSMLKNMQVKCSSKDISQCYKIKTSSKNKKSQVFVKFINNSVKMDAIRNRKLLKGKGIIINEDLTKYKYNLLKQAQLQLGKKAVWAFNGLINITVNGIRQTIANVEDILKFAALENKNQ